MPEDQIKKLNPEPEIIPTFDDEPQVQQTQQAPAAALTSEQITEIMKAQHPEMSVPQVKTDVSPAKPVVADPVKEAYASAYRDNISSLAKYAEEVRKQNQLDRQQDLELVQADTKAAAWTGATEVAASLANLFFVGSKGAANQQYKAKSQDWMTKAEANLTASRTRIQQARERQRALDLEGKKAEINARLGMAQYDAQKRKEDAAIAAQQAKHQLEMAKFQLDAQYKAGQLDNERYKAETDRANKEYLGRLKAIETQANASKAYAQAGAAKAQSGYYSAKASAAGSGGGKNAALSYDVTIDGKYQTLTMPKGTYEQAVKDGKPEIREDVARMAGFNDWESFSSAMQRGRTSMPEYSEIYKALAGTGMNSVDEEKIGRWVNDHRTETNSFNQHLKRVATGSQGYGNAPAPAKPEAAETPETPEAAEAMATAEARTSSWEDKYK